MEGCAPLDRRYIVNLDDVLVEKKTGGSLAETKIINGLVINKKVAHPNMPKRVEEAKIALLDFPLEIKRVGRFDKKFNIESPEQVELFLKEEKGMLRDMVEKIVAKGVNVVLNQKNIDEYPRALLARKKILVVHRINKADMERIIKATGGDLITNLEDLKNADLGRAGVVEEKNRQEQNGLYRGL